MYDPSIQPPPGTVQFNEAWAGWPEVDATLMEDGRGAVPAFPLDVLPTEWARWVEDTATAAGTPIDYVAQGVLAAVAALCGAGVLAQVSTFWAEPLVLWQALVGWPSSGKSPALAAVRCRLDDIEDGLRADDAVRLNRHQARVDAARLTADQWRERCAIAIKEGSTLPERPMEASYEESFVPAQILVGDATLEAMADVVSGNPRGVVLWRDELAAWLANLGRYANGGSDRAHWLEAWAAAGITINRRSRGKPLHLRKFPVSVIGSIQPDRIAEALQGGDDGMAARFLYTWPDPAPYRPLGQLSLADDDAAMARLQQIAAFAGSVDQPRRIGFDDEAFVLLDGFLAELHGRLPEAEGLEAGWLGKGRGTVVRLAAMLALLGWSEQEPGSPPPTVSRDILIAAIELWQSYLWPHARTVFNRAGRTERDRHARRIIRWLRQTKAAAVTRQELRRDALAQAIDGQETDRVALRLEDAGVLRLDVPEQQGRGRPAKRWLVNPRLRGDT
ncbi:MAG: DUF3987 domain-containing protein [Reyranella sp.]|uniref:DUF3987 domain-containing protein n=1 Tax=Reyranella sp. TaxID=1929291 RepID=UPI001AD39CAE|nr:DUF3987 domain-containing protein [Reyranella sp.]MBN9088940.1 DUF3987 domain-containing protein [Reyranella sp.]